MSPDQTLRQRAGSSQRAVVARIMAVWEQANETNREDGAQWYLLQGVEVDRIAKDAGRSREAVAAVVAHLSPRIRWDRNLAGAEELARHDVVISGLMGRSVAAARAALVAEDPLSTLHGPKVTAFAANLLGCPESVTVDVWAARVALGREREDLDSVIKRPGVYAAIAHCYRLAARRAGVTPATMQATTWIVARNGRTS